MKTFDDYNKEIRKNIIDRWVKEGHNAKNVGNDPVINMLLSALSFQAFHIQKNINWFEEKTVRELRDRMIPFHLLKPVPAFSVIETKLKEGCGEKMVDETCSFEFTNSRKQKFTFAPLCNTKIINAELKIINQIEENIWRIELQSNAPLENLSGLSFYLDIEESVEIESIKYGNMVLPLVKPSQYNELPFTRWFNNAHLLLNQNYYLFGTYDYWQDIFLTSHTPLYYINQYDTKKITFYEQNHIELELTFSSPIYIDDILKINCIPVVNVEKREAILDERNPVKDLTSDTGEFLNLLYNRDKNIENVIIRQHGAERYNATQLFEQMQEILHRYNSDYYAFQDIRELKATDKLENLQSIIDEMCGIVSKSEENKIKNHYYAILKQNNEGIRKVELEYLTTSGATANGIRKDEKATKTPVSLDNNKTILLLETKGGNNGISDETQKEDIAKYYFQTKDRLVTPTDIKTFIKTFYYEDGKLGDEIENIIIMREHEYVDIIIYLNKDSVLKNTDKIPALITLLQNKISLKSSGVLPFKVRVL